jgi:undecaprenyl-diphosphatase
MDTIQIIILAIVQGLTEFLPVSSSAHLILVPMLLQWPDQGLVFDVAVHVGSLIAVLIYFRVEVIDMLVAWTQSWVILGTMPAVIVGFLFKGFIESDLRSPWVIAITTIVFGLLLWYADTRKSKQLSEYELKLPDVVAIGLFQALALIPGTSRSGITMTAGLLLGMTRQAAARFSFLLSIPLILASGLLQTAELSQSVQLIDWFALSVAIILSAISAGLCIHFFLRLIEKVGMMPFVIYRLLLGVVLIVLLV